MATKGTVKRLKQIRQLCTEDLYESASTQTDPLLIDTTSIDKTTVPKQEEKKNINNLYLQNNKFKSLNTHWNQNLFTIQTPLLTSRSDPGFHKQFVYSSESESDSYAAPTLLNPTNKDDYDKYIVSQLKQSKSNKRNVCSFLCTMKE